MNRIDGEKTQSRFSYLFLYFFLSLSLCLCLLNDKNTLCGEKNHEILGFKLRKSNFPYSYLNNTNFLSAGM
jgi:hypothetical protein